MHPPLLRSAYSGMLERYVTLCLIASSMLTLEQDQEALIATHEANQVSTQERLDAIARELGPIKKQIDALEQRLAALDEDEEQKKVRTLICIHMFRHLNFQTIGNFN